MHSKGFLLASGALFALATAVPTPQHEHHPRDLVFWITSTAEAVVTVPVTTTIWVDPEPTEPVHQHSQSSFTAETSSSILSALTTASAPTTSTPVESIPVETSPPSSTYVAPAPVTSSAYVAPIPSSTYATSATSSFTSVAAPPSATNVASTSLTAAVTTSSASVVSNTQPSTSSQAPSSGSSSGPAAPGTTYTGDLTNYTPGMGACGWTNGEADKIVAVSYQIFAAYDNNASNGNYVCGKSITITGVNGEAYQATVSDKCMGCEESALDLPLEFFNTVTNNGNGRVHDITWSWN